MSGEFAQMNWFSLNLSSLQQRQIIWEQMHCRCVKRVDCSMIYLGWVGYFKSPVTENQFSYFSSKSYEPKHMFKIDGCENNDDFMQKLFAKVNLCIQITVSYSKLIVFA